MVYSSKQTCSKLNFPCAATPSGILHLQCGILHGMQCGYMLWSVPFRGLQGNIFSPMIISTGRRGNPRCRAWGTFFFFSELAVTHNFFPHSSVLCDILPFLIYIFPEMPLSWLRCSVVPCSESIGTLWIWLFPAWSSPWPLLTWTSPAAPTNNIWPSAFSTDALAGSLVSSVLGHTQLQMFKILYKQHIRQQWLLRHLKV